MPSPDPLTQLTTTVRQGLPGPSGGVRPLLQALFGGRYHKRHEGSAGIRDAYALAAPEADDGVPYAGLINVENPPSGPYGGTSLVWFPTRDEGSVIGFCVGTSGLLPDEGILTRPGHRRRVAALRRQLARKGLRTWSKPDPAALGISIPAAARHQFAEFDRALRRYQHEMYCLAAVPPTDEDLAIVVVRSFLDLYAYERGWQPLKPFEPEFTTLINGLLADLAPKVTAAHVAALLRRRRFVVLQGPPGTGKTRLAEEVRRDHFQGRGMTVQFHPAVTYEDFVVGLFPDPSQGSLRFGVRPGWLLQAAEQAAAGSFLLVIDEINRADLGKILGEAIYLFEAGEVGGPNPRRVQLAHPLNGQTDFALPENLYILGTMNTADRTIAGMDLAVRRRFAFVPMAPQWEVVAAQGLSMATDYYERLYNVFIEHVPDDALDLMPGHAYFLASDETDLRQRLRYELLPLLDEYLRQGYMGPAAADLQSVRDALENEVGYGS